MGTSNPFVKFLWVLFVLVLFGALLQNIIENLSEFTQFTVITLIESASDYPMTLPAITFCFVSYPDYKNNLTLKESLFDCTISLQKCDYTDFFRFEIPVFYYNNAKINCYVLNEGRNSLGQSQEIKQTKLAGIEMLFSFKFYLEKNISLAYYINDALIRPGSTELDNFFEPGKRSFLRMRKHVESKLGPPYNNCSKSVFLPHSELDKKIINRQINCVDECIQKILKNDTYFFFDSGSKEVVSKLESNNCHETCPMECDSIQYLIKESKFDLTPELSVFVPKAESALGIKINSTYSVDRFIGVDIFFNLKYQKISQTPKTTISELVSNLGGSAGLFLDLTFLSVCRSIEFILRLFFRF